MLFIAIVKRGKKIKKYYHRKIKNWRFEKKLLYGVVTVTIPLLISYFDVYERIFVDELEFKSLNNIELPILDLKKTLSDSIQTEVILGHFDIPTKDNLQHRHNDGFFIEKNRIRDSIIKARDAKVKDNKVITNRDSSDYFIPVKDSIPRTIFNSDLKIEENDSTYTKKYASQFLIRNNSEKLFNNLRIEFRNKASSLANIVVNLRCLNCQNYNFEEKGAKFYNKKAILLDNLLSEESLYFDIIADRIITEDDIIIVFDEASSVVTHSNLGIATTSKVDNFFTSLLYNNNILIDIVIFILFMFGVFGSLKVFVSKLLQN